LKSVILFFALSFFLLTSCSNSNSNPISEIVSPSAPNDTINKILKIHPTEKSKLLDALFKNKIKTAHFNGCVLVAQHGRIIYETVSGFADYKTKSPLKINSAFQLASASKTLTAAAILLLKDQEKLKLTDQVQQFIPNFPYQGITLKMLLTHRSGLSNYVFLRTIL
jgi:CubicO group peptidase (beta-lactamase class C family)